MEFTAVAAALLRRWYVVLLGLALTAGLVYVAKDAVPPTYSATGSVLLLPPGASIEDGSNPLLGLGGLEQPAALVVAYLAGEPARRELGEQFPDASYDIVLDPLSRGPLIIVTVENPVADETIPALNAALGALPEALVVLQDQVDAPPISRVTSMPLSVDTEPTTERSDSMRALIAAAGLGTVLTLVGAVAVDSLAARRRERRRSAEPVAENVAARDDIASRNLDTGAAATAPEPKAPAAKEWPAELPQVEAQDFARSEELYGSEWPPRVRSEPALGDESRVARRA